MTERDAETETGLTEDEQALLARWRAPSPPPGFAEALVARALSERAPAEPPSKPRRLGWTALAGAAAAAVLALWWLGRPGGAPVHGELHAAARTTQALGDRAVLVLEPGAHVVWDVDARGAAKLKQDAGDVFYRVDRGGPFEIDTPSGTVRVTGTCFRVEVETMNAKKSGAMGAAAGALVAATVVISVYEGQVVTASEGVERTVAAGEAVALAEGRAPEPLSGRRMEPSRRGRALAPAADDAARSAAALAAPDRESAPLPLKIEAEQLRARVGELEAQVEKLEAKSRDRRTYDLPQEQLEQMASRCELRWDMPGLGSQPQTLSGEEVEALALSAADRSAAEAVLAEYHQEMRREIEKLYLEVTADPNAGSMSMDAMIDEIQDKTPRQEMQVLFQRLAKERAGHVPPPAAGAQLAPSERLMRLLTGAGDRVEGKLAEKLGPDVAHAIRDYNGGFGSRSSSSFGCPK